MTESVRAFDEKDIRLKWLYTIIKSDALFRGEYDLSGGGESDHYFDLRRVTLHPEGSYIVGDLILDFMTRDEVSSVGGPEVSAVPMVSAAAALCFQKIAYGVIFPFFVRRERKAYGPENFVEGFLPPDSRVLMVDDVITTGASVSRAISVARGYGSRVDKVLTILDREEGGAEALEKLGVTLYTAFRESDFEETTDKGSA